jgi:hypothetical protein
MDLSDTASVSSHGSSSNLRASLLDPVPLDEMALRDHRRRSVSPGRADRFWGSSGHSSGPLCHTSSDRVLASQSTPAGLLYRQSSGPGGVQGPGGVAGFRS